MESQTDSFTKEVLRRQLRTAVYSWSVFSGDLQSLSELLGHKFPDSSVMDGVLSLANTENSAWEVEPSDLDNFLQGLERTPVTS